MLKEYFYEISYCIYFNVYRRKFKSRLAAISAIRKIRRANPKQDITLSVLEVILYEEGEQP